METTNGYSQFRAASSATYRAGEVVVRPQLACAALDALEHHLCVVDARGRILTVNRAWREFARANLGDPATACEGADYLGVCDRATGQDAEIARAFGTGLRAMLQGTRSELTLEYPCDSPDTQRWFRASVFRSADSLPARLVVLHENITAQKRRETILRRLTEGFLRLQDEERRAFARELHDSTAQKVAAIIIGLGLVEEELASGKVSRGSSLVAECLTAAEACATDIRSLCARLHPPLLDELGLGVALEAYVNGLLQREGLHVTLEMGSDVDRLPKDLSLALFRVVQECLSNVLRHSGSQTASVTFAVDQDRLVLQVTDPGAGISDDMLTLLRERQPGPGMGILGMRERLALFGGALEIDASPNGTSVRAIVPLPPPHHEHNPHPAG